MIITPLLGILFFSIIIVCVLGMLCKLTYDFLNKHREDENEEKKEFLAICQRVVQERQRQIDAKLENIRRDRTTTTRTERPTSGQLDRGINDKEG